MEKYEELYSDLNIKINNIENEVKNNTEDIRKIYEEQKALTKIANSVEILATELRYVSNNVSDVKVKQDDVVAKFENLEKKVNNVEVSDAIKSKNLTDSIKEKALWLIVSGILLYILSQILPQIFKWFEEI